MINSKQELLTLYEIYQSITERDFFWVKCRESPLSVIKVVGWSPYISVKYRALTGAIGLTESFNHTPKVDSTKIEDFLEYGHFVGYRYYPNKEIPISDLSEPPVPIIGGSTRSWLIA